MKGSVLVLADQVILPASAVMSAIKEVGNETSGENDALVITQASMLSNNSFYHILSVFIPMYLVF